MKTCEFLEVAQHKIKISVRLKLRYSLANLDLSDQKSESPD